MMTGSLVMVGNKGPIENLGDRRSVFLRKLGLQRDQTFFLRISVNLKFEHLTLTPPMDFAA
jgi:hypothetical protein